MVSFLLKGVLDRRVLEVFFRWRRGQRYDHIFPEGPLVMMGIAIEGLNDGVLFRVRSGH